MNYFIDITVKPDRELSENFLLNKVYTKLHKALYDMNSSDIAVSFPEWKIKPGRTIRIHSDKYRLEELQKLNWIGGLSGYCEIKNIEKIPANVKYRTVSRIQPNMSKAKLKRLMKRNNISQEEVSRYKEKMFKAGFTNPYIEIESASNGKLHRRYLRMGELSDTAVIGKFDSFGLSKEATVPWF